MPYLPELRLPAAVSGHGVDRSQARVAVQQAAGEALKAHRVLDGQPEVPQFDLRVCAGQRDRARDRAAVVVSSR